jgi:hypothetical protein
VAALVAGILALATHLCAGPAAPTVFAGGWVLIGTYFLLMVAWKVLDWLGICNTDLCEAAAITMGALSLLGGVLFFLSLLFICFWPPAWNIQAGFVAFWGPILAGCYLKK